MKILKALAASLTAFILFWSLLFLGSVISLQATVLNPEYIDEQVAGLDVAGLLQETVGEQIKSQIPAGLESMKPLVDEVILDAEPWAKAQLNLVADGAMDYLTGKTSALDITIDMKPLKALSAAKLPQLQLPFEDNYRITAAMIPSPLDMGVPYVRWVGANIQLVYWGFIGLSLLMVIFTILLYRDLKAVTGTLGSTFFTVGLIEYIVPLAMAIWVIPNFLPEIGAGLGLGESGLGLMTQVMNDSASPLKVFGIGLAASGAALWLFSKFYRRGENS
jgi:hypothetical protein